MKIGGFGSITDHGNLKNLKTAESSINFSKIIIFLILILFGTIIFSGAVSAAGLGNTPQPKFHHDNNNTGQSEYKGPQTNNTKWKYTTGGGILSSPSMGSDGTIYFGSYDKKFYALYPNGTKKWSLNLGEYMNYSPAIDDKGIIYLGGYKNLYAIYPNGTLKWNYTNGNYISSSAAIGSDGTIYFGNYYKLSALNPDGSMKWNFTTLGIIEFSPPAIGSDGTIYMGSEDGHLYALYSNGTEKWNFTTNNMILSSPAIGSDGTIYISSGNKLYSITSTGNLKWEYSITNTTDRLFSSPAIESNGALYVGSDNGYLYAFNPDGTLKWKYQTGNGIDSSPCIGSGGVVYVGSNDGCVYAFNPDGTLKWKYQTGNGIDSSPCIGSDGTLYIGSMDNNLYAFHDRVIPPTVSSNLKSGIYNTDKTVKLTMNENGTIYYTLNGKTPTTASNRYTGPITIKSTTTLKYFAVDLAGNRSPVYTMNYTIDKTAPKIIQTTPANNARGVALTTPVTIKFSKKIVKGTRFSNIFIKNMSTGKITRTTITISGNTLTIKMLKSRLTRNNYEVYIPTGAVKDMAGNSNSKYLLNFRTRA